MNHATVQQLVAQLSGEHVTGFFLVLARISPLFLLAPLFSSRMIPKHVRGIIAVALAIGLTGIASHGQQIPVAPLQIAALLVKEVLVGLGFALILGTLNAALQLAGSLTDASAGFSFGSIIDPLNGNQGGTITQVYGMVGLLTFVAIGGDAWMLRGLKSTFDVVPLTRGPQMSSLVAGTLQAFGQVFVSAIEVAAPALLALLITDVAFGMVSRVVPQLNVFAVGFPTKIAVGLLVVAASLPFLGGWISDQISTSVFTALHSLRIG